MAVFNAARVAPWSQSVSGHAGATAVASSVVGASVTAKAATICTAIPLPVQPASRKGSQNPIGRVPRR